MKRKARRGFPPGRVQALSLVFWGVWLHEDELVGSVRWDRHELQLEGVTCSVLEGECDAYLSPVGLVAGAFGGCESFEALGFSVFHMVSPFVLPRGLIARERPFKNPK